MLLKFRKENKYKSNEKALAVTETKNSIATVLQTDQPGLCPHDPWAAAMICTGTWRHCKSSAQGNIVDLNRSD